MAPPPSEPRVRALAWQWLEEAATPLLGAPRWGEVVAEVGGPPSSDLEPAAPLPFHPYAAALRALEARAGPSSLRAAGRHTALAWARAYRNLARRLEGDPAAFLEVFCGEVRPWLLGVRGPVLDAGGASALVAPSPELPAPFEEGLLGGLAEAAGVEARVVRQGAAWVVTWEASQAARRRPGRAALLARAVRIGALPATMVPLLVGAALAWRDSFFDPLLLALTGAGVALLQLAANAANDWFDHRSRADDANLTPTRFSGGSRVIQRGLLTPRAMLALAGALYAAGTATGIALALHLQAAHGAGLREVLALGAVGVLLGVLYSAPPARLAHRGLGELAVGLGFGPLVIAGTYLVQAVAAGAGPAIHADALLFGVPVGALIAALLTINALPDRPWDALAGKRTLAVRLGPRAVQGYGALLALAYGSIAVLALARQAWPLLLALATVPLAARAWAHARREHERPHRLLPANAATYALHTATGLLLSGSIVLASLLGRA